ncbi:MAG: terminase family protein [Pseudomonadota bacterium]
MTAPISKAEWERQRREAMDVMDELAGKLPTDEAGLPKVLLGYQAKTVGLLDTVSTKVLFVEKSRRIGLTWALAAYAVLSASRPKSRRGMDAIYISYAQEMTREFIDACAMWARAFNIAASEIEDGLFDEGDIDGDKAIQTFRIRFSSGYQVKALSSTPRGLRGKEGRVIIDEAAFVDDLGELIKAAMAFLIWGGQVIVCSTHDGADNTFNEQIQDILGGRLPYKHLKIDLDDALHDGLYERICLVSGTEWTPEGEAQWRQDLIDFYGEGADEELFCIPSLSSGAWIPAPLIEARMTAEAPVLRLELPGDYLHLDPLAQKSLMAPFLEELEEQLHLLKYQITEPRYAVGFDFARVADLSCMPVLAVEQNLKRREVFSIEMRNVPGDEQKLVVGMVLEHLKERLLGAAFDATGMGWTVAEDMGRFFGLREDEDSPGLIWAIKFTQDWYRIHMPPLKTAFEDDMIAIGADEDHLTDMRSVKVVRGIPRVPEIRTNEKGEAKDKKGKKRHGDYAIGLALAHFASRMRWIEYGYRSASQFKRHHRAEARMSMTPRRDRDMPQRDPHRAPLGARIRGDV